MQILLNQILVWKITALYNCMTYDKGTETHAENITYNLQNKNALFYSDYHTVFFEYFT